MAEVALENVDKIFGPVHVIKSVDLAIADDEFCVFVGPSGCGKSTLLRLIAGLEDASSGTIRIGGRDVTRLPPAQRGVAMVFQSYALYPHMKVADNITFGLKTAKTEKGETARRLQRAAKMLQLEHLLDRKPAQLSGGQRQRVAIGRAIVREPQVFLFDEPLSNLDAALRTQMRIEIGRLHKELGATMVYVTHDQVEAMTMADKIVVLNAGRVEQVGAPLELYHRPTNLFVAGFIGSPKMNLIRTRVAESGGGLTRVELPGGSEIGVPSQGAKLQKGQPVVLGVRPEHLSIGNSVDGQIPGRVRLTEHLGAETILYVDVPDSEPIVVRSGGLAREQADVPVRIGLRAMSCHIFAPEGQALVNGTLI
jgi:multiple sugar transport system ATP-binding protein